MRLADVFPAIVSREEFDSVRAMLESRSPDIIHPRRVSSPYLFSESGQAQEVRQVAHRV